MFDLFFILVAMLAPALLEPLGVPSRLTISVLTASLMVWPGYAATLLVWPNKRAGQVELKLVLAPFFSILLLMAASLFGWVVGFSVGPGSIYPYAAGLVVGLLIATAVARKRSHEGAGGDEYEIESATTDGSAVEVKMAHRGSKLHYGFVGAFVLFMGLSLVLGVAAIRPQQAEAETRPLALHIDPSARPRYDLMLDSLQISLVMEVSRQTSASIMITGRISGKQVTSQRVQLSTGEQHIALSVPRALMNGNEAQILDIRAQYDGAQGAETSMLRLRLDPFQGKPRGGGEE